MNESSGSDEFGEIAEEIERVRNSRESEQFLAALQRLRALAENGSVDAATYLGELLGFQGLVHDPEEAYKWFYVGLSQSGYTVEFRDENHTPPYYCGPVGDFRNESLVNDLVVALGFEKTRELDRQAELLLNAVKERMNVPHDALQLTSRAAMQQLHSDLWIADSPLRFFGLEVGARMTVVRLPGPKLLLHSPLAAAPDLVREVKSLGPVAYLVAPNRFHHLYIGEWQRACPEALLYVAPGLESKRADLAIEAVLGNEPEPGWKGVVDQVLLAGFPFANEVVFFHRPSATLIASDLAFNVGASSPPLTRLAFRLLRTYGRLSPTLLERLLVRDRAAFRHSLERILEWPFDRVVVAHGEVSETDGRAELLRGYSWLLSGGRAD